MTKELLFELTQAEFWVWHYLLVLAREQGGSPVTIPGPGKDPRVEKVYSRKHLKRLLHSLRRKACLTRIIIPRSKGNAIEVYLPISLIEDTHAPDNGKLKTAISKINSCKSSNSSSSSFDQLSSSLLEIVKSKATQEELMEAIRELDQIMVRRMRGLLGQMINMEPKCKVSEEAKLFAQMRYLQEKERIGKPQAWLDTVARKAEEHMISAKKRLMGEQLRGLT